AYDEYWTVFIDYNHNGAFTDGGELVAQGHATVPINLSFAVPATALNGVTRMRVIMQYYFYQTNTCGSYSYGETEDYSVNITGNAAISVASTNHNSNAPITQQQVEEPAVLSAVTLYPNPALDNLNIEFGSRQSGNARLSVYN